MITKTKEKKVVNTNSGLTQKLNKLSLARDAEVTLRYENGQQVMHYTGDYLNKVFEDTNVIGEVAHLVSYDGVRKSNSIINDLRINGMLDDYERGSFTFEDYVYDAVKNDWYDYIEESVEQWDYKRGMCNVFAEVKVPLNLLAEAEDCGLTLDNAWRVFVRTDAGVLEVER